MKILQIGKFYPPTLGGMETVVQSLSEGLQKAGMDVTVLCSGPNSRFSEELISGVKVIRVPHFGNLFSQPISPALFTTLNRLASSFDVLHFHVPNPLAEMASLFIPKSIPRVVTYHADATRQKILLPLYRPLLNVCLNRADRIIAPTRLHVQHSPLISHWMNSPKLRIIPFGIDPDRFVLTPKVENHSSLLLKKYGKFALFVGRLVPYKGLPFLIQAMKEVAQKIPDLNLVILGQGPKQKELIAQVEKCQLENRVHFEFGSSGDSSLLGHYHACQFLVLPSVSRTEAFGMVLLEAMACGKPLITTRIYTGVQEVNIDQVTGLHINPKDSKALAEAMIQLGSSPELLQRYGQASRNRFLNHYTLEPMIAEHQKVYNERSPCPNILGRSHF